MKIFYLILFSLFSNNIGLAQNVEIAKTVNLVTKNANIIGLNEKQLDNYIVSNAYSSDGFLYSYLTQSYKGLPVHNQMIVLSSKDGELKSMAGAFIEKIDELVTSKNIYQSISSKVAVQLAFESEKLTLENLGKNQISSNFKFNYGTLSNVTEKVEGDLIWMPIEDKGKIKSVNLAWTVLVAPLNNSDVLKIIIDAVTGKVLGKLNYTNSDNWDMKAPKNEKVYKRSIINTENLNEQNTNKPSIVAGASYLVVPYPAESPIHTGGSPAVRSNPWTAAVGNASTLGWHSDGNTDYNISRGNNVWATEDTLFTNQNTGTPAISSTSPDPLTFNSTPNFSLDPRTSTNQKFTITNLFYWNNIIHDITYQYGFTEPAGNFQSNNLGRGGNGGDHVIGLAQSYFGSGNPPPPVPIGNNANFSTPVDGGRGRMRMYLFAAPVVTKVKVNLPASAIADYVAVEENFSTGYDLGTNGSVTAEAVLFTDATGGLGQACGGAPTNNITGKIAIINRGNCSFVIKVKAAQDAGAIGVIMINNVAGAPIVMGGTDNTITIPAVMVSDVNGTVLTNLLPGLNVTISSQAGVPLDGDLDNGVVVHEYGHGISNRLTGGPANSSCLGNAEQGGEGWSDYLGLMLTTNWATANINDGPVARGVGNYVTAQNPTTGVGIRNFPYSTNLSVNALTYANMGTGTIGTEVHNIGEIWCVAIWDMTWGIIAQENAINPNLYNFDQVNTTGGNSIALKLVLEGMKLQPCSPGFIDARNAILAADRNLYAGRHACSIWTAFAKRGMGFGASQGSAGSATDQTATTIMPPAPTITTQPVDASVAAGTNATFTCVADVNVNMIYRWEVSTNGGTSWNPVSPAVITNTLTLTAVSSTMNGNRYRCVTFIGCATTTSANAILTVTGSAAPPVITTNPANAIACAGTNVTFTGAATGATTYNWQVSTNGGTSFLDVSPINTTATLTLNTVTVAMNNNQYRLTATNGSGSVNTTVATLTVNASPAAPTVTPTAAYCQGATTTPLTATGTNLLWYTTATGGTGSGAAPTLSTSTAGVTSYFVSQTVSTCESPRATITVTVNATPNAPTATATVSYCQGATATILTATGTNLLWYATATGGTGSATAPTPSTASVGSTIFYVSQTTNSCESPRTSITVTITATPAAPTVTSPIIYCQGVSANPLTATGSNLLWYTTSTGGTGSSTAPTPSTATVGSIVYYVSQTTGCESPRVSITVNIVAGTAAPIVTSPIAYCQNATATALTATGTSLLWYTGATGGTGSSTAPTPITASAGSITYYVTQTSGACESPRAAIVVNTTATPAAPTVTTPITYCQNATAVALTATGTNLKWYTVATGGTGNTTAPTPATTTIGTTTFYVTQTTGTCEGPRAAIVVNVTAVTAAPTAISPVVYCQGSTSVALSATGTNLLWYAASTGGTGSTTAPTPSTSTVGSTTFYVTQTGTCESVRAAIVVTVNTTPAAPTVTTPIAFCQGGTATALTATGTGLLWYGINVTGGTGVTTATIPSISTTGTSTYYVSQTTGLCEGPRAAIVVNVGAAPAITVQPTDITSCATSATFNVTATGALLTYQWQVSTDGGTAYSNITAANSSSLSLNGLTAAQSNFKYRVVISSASCPSVTSNAVSVRVGTPPIVILTASPSVNFNPSTNGGLFTAATPPSNTYTYAWKRNSNIISNTTSSLTKANGLLDDFGTYIVTVNDNTTGCFGISNPITISDIASERDRLFIGPNPTTGTIRVSYYSDNTASQTRKIIVYDAKGARLMFKEFTVSGRYGNMDVDLSRYVAGNYTIVLTDASGKKLASEVVVKY